MRSQTKWSWLTQGTYWKHWVQTNALPSDKLQGGKETLEPPDNEGHSASDPTWHTLTTLQKKKQLQQDGERDEKLRVEMS